MKKYLAIVAVAALLTGCVEHQNDRCVYPNCWNGALQYTVSEPVETIYRNTTYTTVYEPKTYATTTYTRCKN